MAYLLNSGTARPTAFDLVVCNDLLRVVNGKGGYVRLLPPHAEVLTVWWDLPMPRAGLVFSRPRGGPWTPGTLSNDFNRWFRDKGVQATVHQLRHWIATSIRGRGISG